MRIVNPRSSINNTPLATTWYVDTQIDNAKQQVETLVSTVSGVIDSKINDEAAQRTLYDKAVAIYLASKLTGKADLPSSIPANIWENVKDFVNGYDIKNAGYAWLSDGKLDPSLLPDLSIITPVNVKSETIINWFDSNGGLDTGSEMSIALAALSSEEERAEYVIEQFVCKAGLHENGTLGSSDAESPFVKTGDMVIVTMTTGDIEGKPYLSKRYLGGAWSIIANNKPTTPEASASLVKISFNQGEITQVNEKTAKQDGSVHLALADIYRHAESDIGGETNTLIGTDLAHDILSITSIPASTYTNLEPSAIPGLALDGNRLGFRQRHGVSDTEFIPYTTLKEFLELCNTVDNSKNELSGINTSIDAISAVIGDVTSSILISSTVSDTVNNLSEKINKNSEDITAISAALDRGIEVVSASFTWTNEMSKGTPSVSEFRSDLYPNSENIIKLSIGENGNFPGKIMSVYQVTGVDALGQDIEEMIYPEIKFVNGYSIITTYSYNAIAAGYETALGKTWKVYYTK